MDQMAQWAKLIKDFDFPLHSFKSFVNTIVHALSHTHEVISHIQLLVLDSSKIGLNKLLFMPLIVENQSQPSLVCEHTF